MIHRNSSLKAILISQRKIVLVNKANPKFIDMFLDVVFSVDDEPVNFR